jgi:hypothetical protein
LWWVWNVCFTSIIIVIAVFKHLLLNWNIINPLPFLILQNVRDLNVPCRPKHSKALLLSCTFKCPLKKKSSLSAHAVGL